MCLLKFLQHIDVFVVSGVIGKGADLTEEGRIS